MIQCVILDADHTLYTPEAERAYEEQFAFIAEETGRSTEAVRAAWNAAAEAIDGSRNPDDRYRKHVIADVLDRLDVDHGPALVDGIYDRFWEVVTEDMAVDADIDALIDALRDAGVTVVAIATNEFPDALDRKLETAMDDPGAFDAIVTPRETGSMKPSKAFYTTVLDEHGIAPENVIVAGDSWENDLVPARELGAITVLVGGDDGSPDHRIGGIDELPKLVEALNDES